MLVCLILEVSIPGEGIQWEGCDVSGLSSSAGVNLNVCREQMQLWRCPRTFHHAHPSSQPALFPVPGLAERVEQAAMTQPQAAAVRLFAELCKDYLLESSHPLIMDRAGGPSLFSFPGYQLPERCTAG